MSEPMKPSGYRFIGDIPSDWETMRLHEVANLFGRIGWQGLTSDEYTDEGAYLITGTDFKDGGINWETCVHVSEKRWEEAYQIKVQNGDLLISKDGTIGKLAIVGGLAGHASLNSGLMRIVPVGAERYSTKYLYYVLSSDVFYVWYENITSGASTIKHLFQGDFNHFVFPIPPLSEQKTIASYLDAETAKLDKALSLLQEQVSTLESYKRSLIQETVTKGLDPNVPMKPSGYMFIGDIPKEWKTQRLHEVANLFGRIGWQGLTSDEYTDEGAYLITGTDFKNGEINWDTCVHVSEQRWEEAYQIKVQNGDLLITKDGTIGKLAIVGGLAGHASLNSGLMRIVPNGNDPYSTKYMYYVLSSDVFCVWYENITSGASTIKHLFQGDFNHFVFPFPPKAEQQAIANYLDIEITKLDKALAAKRQQIEVLTKQRQSLIYEYVTGKRRVG